MTPDGTHTASSGGKQPTALESYLLSVMRGRKGALPVLLRALMTALAPIYCAGLKLYLLPYRLGVRKRYHLPCPVICIGNLTTGGTGKTPMTQLLVRMLLDAGRRPVILSRGYGGENEYGCGVVSDGQKLLLNAGQAGDEAYLLATLLPEVPVLVGKDRRVTGRLACRRFQPDVIVLDDGMQFWQLHRDLDIVLLNASAPFDNGWTFPRGLLREPPSHLRRAGIIVLTGTQQAGPERVGAAQRQAKRYAPNTLCFTANLQPMGVRGVSDRVEYSVSWLQSRHVAALSALGNPDSFEAMLGTLGAVVEPRFRFRDHQAITLADLEQVLQEACAAGAEAILTTEKDAAKMVALKTPLPILTLQVGLEVDPRPDFLNAVLARII